MCCYTTLQNPHTKDEDIICWKVFEVKLGFIYKTPFIGRLVRKSVIQGKSPYKARGKEEYAPTQAGRYVCGGFVHAFTDKESAERFVSSHKKRKLVIKTGLIKAGTPYYADESSEGNGICAKQILFLSD